MGTGNNLFGNEPQVDVTNLTGEDALSQLLGEGKKYSTPEEMAKALMHSQKHIQTLEQETATLRDTANSAKGVDEILAALATQQGTPEPSPADQQHSSPVGTPSVDDIVAQAVATLKADNVQSLQEANQQKVKDTLASKYGQEASRVYTEVGKTLNVNLDELAAKSPDAVLQLVANARPAQATNNNLPGSTRMTGSDNSGSQVTKKVLDAMYAKGEITLVEKHQREAKQLATVGPAEFFK